MTSDDLKTGRDVRFTPVGTGGHATFACASCTKHMRITGRKLARVMGIMQYVCAGCSVTLLAKKEPRA